MKSGKAAGMSVEKREMGARAARISAEKGKSELK